MEPGFFLGITIFPPLGGGWQAMRRNGCSENKFGGSSWDQTLTPPKAWPPVGPPVCGVRRKDASSKGSSLNLGSSHESVPALPAREGEAP